MTGTPTTDNEKPQAWKGGCLSTRPDTVQEAKTFFLLQSKLQLLRGQMSSLVSISSPSDTVSTQEMGISAHTTQCLSIHNPFGLHTKSPASKWLYHFEPNKHETLMQQRNHYSIKRREKKYNAWPSLWIIWLKALEAEFEPWIRVAQCPLALLCPAHSRACQWREPWVCKHHNVSLGLNRSKCQQLLWMRTHESRVGWKPVLDNSSGLIHKECWRGGRELLKTGSYSNQLLSHSNHSHVHSLLHVFCPTQSYQASKSSSTKKKSMQTVAKNLVFQVQADCSMHGRTGFHLAFTWQPLSLCLKIPQLALLQEVLKLCMATYLSTHILSPPYWALGHGLSCQAKFHPKQFLNTHPINPLQRELVMEILTETWRDSRAAIAAYYTSASLAADPSLRHLHFPLAYLG